MKKIHLLVIVLFLLFFNIISLSLGLLHVWPVPLTIHIGSPFGLVFTFLSIVLLKPIIISIDEDYPEDISSSYSFEQWLIIVCCLSSILAHLSFYNLYR